MIGQRSITVLDSSGKITVTTSLKPKLFIGSYKRESKLENYSHLLIAERLPIIK